MSGEFDIDVLLFGSKRCPVCGLEKAANTEQFARDRCERDGLTRVCRACRRARGRASYWSDPEKFKERNRAYSARRKRLSSRRGGD